MNQSVKMVLVLTLISTLTGGLLSMWDGYTAPMIEAHRLRELKAAIGEVLPKHDYYDEITEKGLTLYVARKKDRTNPVGVAFRAIGSGFQGKITVMIGSKPGFDSLTGIKILEQIETPGLGTKIIEDSSNKEDPFWFPNQFKGIKIQHEIKVIKNAKPSSPDEIEAIAGATITSKAVVRIMNQMITKARNLYKLRG